ncbi:nucleotidyltransferase substrate binding protein [Ferrovum myxofaciens]|uniref:nucleotidyltransferase substrate binding protein n=1 Tax=Ferrovum myxofaciens TaxID=416213 RepID=UPI003EBFBEF0
MTSKAGEKTIALDINPLVNAIARLEEGLNDYRRNTTYTLIRDGLIQRFEFTYEIAHKMLKRYLESISPTPEEYDSMPFQDLIRSGNEQGLLLGDWPKWRGYRDMRSKTSHTYEEEIALEVVANIPSFLDEASYFRDKLNQRLTR